jgi:anaerobic ribonucleoside-triphosphate reductase
MRQRPQQFIELAKERFEFAARALTIKSNALKQFGKGAMPFLMQKGNGDSYFRIENCSKLINLVGIQEAIETLTETPITSEESRKFSENSSQTFLLLGRNWDVSMGNAFTPYS